MKLSGYFRRWTMTKGMLAVAGALAIGVAGSAVAFSPTIAPALKWQGGVEFNSFTLVTGGFSQPFTVPAGRSFLLTDLVITNMQGERHTFDILSGAGGRCEFGTVTSRLNSLIVKPGDNTILAFQTGIGFASGQAVCVAASASMGFSGRGFLFTPAPAS